MSRESLFQALAIVGLAIVWFLLLWVAISFAVASASGLRRLRRLYATSPDGERAFAIAGYLGPSRFRGRALVARSTPAGLYLDVHRIFRIGAGAVLIPWREIELPVPNDRTEPLVTFGFPRAATRLRVSPEIAAKLLEGK